MQYRQEPVKLDQKLLLHKIERTGGVHVLAELHGRMPEVLDDMEHIHETVVDALEGTHQILNVFTHKFHPQGVSVVVALAESHFTVHTYPEKRYAAIDFFTCSDKVDPVAIVVEVDRNLI